MIIGSFLGDLDLLVYSQNDLEEKVRVAMPLDPRADWHTVGENLFDFLKRYIANGGEKFWEPK